MRSKFKATAIGAVAVLGMVSAAAVAQPAADQRAQPNQQMGQQMGQQMMQGPGGMGGMAMMQDPEMREQMMKMMSACQKMMGEMQTDRSGADRT